MDYGLSSWKPSSGKYSLTLSRKLDASLRYLQLQVGSIGLPLEQDYYEWAYVAPLCWVKTIWQTIDLCSIDLKTKYDRLKRYRFEDQV